MSTRCALYIQTDDSTDWWQIYCHYDGNPEHMVPALKAADPKAILEAGELRGIGPDGTLNRFEDACRPKRLATPEMPIWASHAYILTYPGGWHHAMTDAQLLYRAG